MTIQIPMVHTNGDTRAELVRQNRAVYGKAKDLLDALSEAAPNARNYYILGNDAIEQFRTSLKQAQSEHHQRVLAVVSIRTDAEIILHAIMKD